MPKTNYLTLERQTGQLRKILEAKQRQILKIRFKERGIIKLKVIQILDQEREM